MYFKCVTGLPSKLSRVVPGRLFVNVVELEVLFVAGGGG